MDIPLHSLRCKACLHSDERTVDVHCYMFKEEPKTLCGQFKPRRFSPSPDQDDTVLFFPTGGFPVDEVLVIACTKRKPTVLATDFMYGWVKTLISYATEGGDPDYQDKEVKADWKRDKFSRLRQSTQARSSKHKTKKQSSQATTERNK